MVLDFYLDVTYVYIGVDVLLYHIKWSEEQCDDILLYSIYRYNGRHRYKMNECFRCVKKIKFYRRNIFEDKLMSR